MGILCGLLFVQQLIQLIHKGADVLELAIDGSEADIGNLIYALQLIHDQLADLSRGNFPFHLVLQCLLDLAGDLLQRSHGNGTLFTGLQHAAQQLALVKGLAAAVTLDDHQRKTFHDLIGGEALVTLQTFAAAANAAALLSGTGVYNFAFQMGTIGTFHG